MPVATEYVHPNTVGCSEHKKSAVNSQENKVSKPQQQAGLRNELRSTHLKRCCRNDGGGS